jgi:hypothetical protein
LLLTSNLSPPIRLLLSAAFPAKHNLFASRACFGSAGQPEMLKC